MAVNLLLAVLVAVVRLLKGTLGLAGAVVLDEAVVVVVFDCNVVRGAVVGLGAVVFVGLAFGAGAVVGRLIVFVAGASFETFLALKQISLKFNKRLNYKGLTYCFRNRFNISNRSFSFSRFGSSCCSLWFSYRPRCSRGSFWNSGQFGGSVKDNNVLKYFH